MRKKVASMLTALCMTASMIAAVPFTAKAEETSGKCGDNIKWTLNDEGLLTISGKGKLGDYLFVAPWCEEKETRERIKVVKIESGVTDISHDAISTPFQNCINLKSVIIPDTLEIIGKKLFRNV